MAALMDQDGAAFVVHAGPDDLMTDPSGNSGGRIACGVFQPS
jgi:Cu-Zn family superoxide dismutase